MSLDQSLTAEQRRRLGRIKGGLAVHTMHPNLARDAGSKGGKASVAANPAAHSPTAMRLKALSRRPRWELALLARMQEEGKPSNEK